VERAGIILAYLDEPSAYAVARAMGVSQQTVTRCLQRAAELGVLAVLDDRARTGREATITAEARTWPVGLACAKPMQFGYPHELWTTRFHTARQGNENVRPNPKPGPGHGDAAGVSDGRPRVRESSFLHQRV
jgi:transposase